MTSGPRPRSVLLQNYESGSASPARRAGNDPHIVAVGSAQLPQPRLRCCVVGLPFRIVRRDIYEQADPPHPLALRRVCGERPRNCRTAKKEGPNRTAPSDVALAYCDASLDRGARSSSQPTRAVLKKASQKLLTVVEVGIRPREHGLGPVDVRLRTATGAVPGAVITAALAAAIFANRANE